MSLTSLVLKDGSVLSLRSLDRGEEGTIRVELEDQSTRDLEPSDLDVVATLLANAPEPAGQGHTAEPLELKALKHDTSGEYLTVEGLVTNVSEQELRDLAVKVMGYDEQGDFVTSGEALRDFNPLAAGSDSPFKAILKSAGRIKKAQVQFYHLMGEVLPHAGIEATLEV